MLWSCEFGRGMSSATHGLMSGMCVLSWTDQLLRSAFSGQRLREHSTFQYNATANISIQKLVRAHRFPVRKDLYGSCIFMQPYEWTVIVKAVVDWCQRLETTKYIHYILSGVFAMCEWKTLGETIKTEILFFSKLHNRVFDWYSFLESSNMFFLLEHCFAIESCTPLSVTLNIEYHRFTQYTVC